MKGVFQENFDYFEENLDGILFQNAEEAWFWFCKYDGRTGYKSNISNKRIIRPCQRDDIYIVVSKLYIAKKIGERHLKTLIKYGRMQIAPDSRVVEEQEEALWWDDAMDKLETIFIKKGIVKCKI